MLVNIDKRARSKVADAGDSSVRRTLYVFGLSNAQSSQSSEARQLRLSAQAGKGTHIE